MARDVTIRLPDGREILLVHAAAVERWDDAYARHQLRAAVLDNAFVGHDLVRFADREALLTSWDASFDEAIDALAHALDRGTLAAIRLADPHAGLRPWTGTVAPLDWDDVQPLADLRRPEPPVAPARPSPTPPPAWVDPSDAWTSFEVLDDRGAPADGAFRCPIDGETHEGELGRTVHAFRDLSTSVSARLQLTRLRFAETTMHLDGPVPGGTPTTPANVPTQRTTFEVVDDEGRSLPGRYVLALPEGERAGPLAGRVAIEDATAARLRLHLEPLVKGG